VSVLDFIFATNTSQPDYLNDSNYWMVGAFGGRKTVSGEQVTPDSATTLSAYYAIIRCISEDVAKLPFVVYKRQARGKERAPDHPLYGILKYGPNKYMSSMSWREAMTAAALGWGGGFSEIVKDSNDRVSELHFIHPRNVTVKVHGTGEPYYDVRQPDGKTRTLEAEQMFHLHGIGGDGVTGWSLLRCAAESIGLGIALQKFSAAFFGNGATISGVLEHPKTIKKEAKDYLRESWNQMHQGAENSHRIAILEEGMKFNKVGVPPEEAQFAESKAMSVVDLCRFGRVPPHKVQHLDRATWGNVELLNIEYVTDCLHSWFVRWENEVQRKLLLEHERETFFAEHVANALMRGDAAARSAYYREMVNAGIMSPNEIRELENMNPIGDEGDKHYIQGAMVPLDMAAKGPQTPAAQKPLGDMPAPKQEPKAEATNLFYAQRKVFMDAAQRVVRKECMALARMGRKHKTFGAFAEDVGKFHAEQGTYFVEQFAAVNLIGITDERLRTAASKFLLNIFTLATWQYGCGIDALEASLKTWEMEQPIVIVNKLLGEDDNAVAA
jgi:HK97 family phage portal protein